MVYSLHNPYIGDIKCASHPIKTNTLEKWENQQIAKQSRGEAYKRFISFSLRKLFISKSFCVFHYPKISCCSSFVESKPFTSRFTQKIVFKIIFFSRHLKVREKKPRQKVFPIEKPLVLNERGKFEIRNFPPHFTSFAFYVFVRVVWSQLCVFSEEKFSSRRKKEFSSDWNFSLAFF